MAGPTSDLFVYGTLMRDASGVFGQTERDRLRAESTFTWLDLYEGIEPSQSGVDGILSPEYLRRPVAAALYNGEPCTAWVYAYIGSLRGARFLPEARWSGRNI